MLLAQGSLQQLQQRPWLGRVSHSFSHLHLWASIKEAIMIRILLWPVRS